MVLVFEGVGCGLVKVNQCIPVVLTSVHVYEPHTYYKRDNSALTREHDIRGVQSSWIREHID